jgi:hypothetical protein
MISTRETVRQLLGEEISDRATLAMEGPIEIVQIRESDRPGWTGRRATLVSGNADLESELSLTDEMIGTPVDGGYRSSAPISPPMRDRIAEQLERWRAFAEVGDVHLTHQADWCIEVTWNRRWRPLRAWIARDAHRVIHRRYDTDFRSDFRSRW